MRLKKLSNANTKKRVRLKVCIGTDSQVKGDETEFATVIVFLREHAAAALCSFITKKHGSVLILKNECWLKWQKALKWLTSFAILFIQYNVDMEVHADINTNPHFKSNDALHEAMGYIIGMGFAFKAKPEAFASSCCADKVCN